MSRRSRRRHDVGPDRQVVCERSRLEREVDTCASVRFAQMSRGPSVSVEKHVRERRLDALHAYRWHAHKDCCDRVGGGGGRDPASRAVAGVVSQANYLTRIAERNIAGRGRFRFNESVGRLARTYRGLSAVGRADHSLLRSVDRNARRNQGSWVDFYRSIRAMHRPGPRWNIPRARRPFACVAWSQRSLMSSSTGLRLALSRTRAITLGPMAGVDAERR